MKFVLYVLISYKYGTSLRYGLSQWLVESECSHTFMQRKKDTRELILSQTYKLLFVYNWEAITIEQIEGSIGRTRGAIFYFFKNKSELFNSIILERFLCKFDSSEISCASITNSTITGFFSYYRTPFERICTDITENYGQADPNPALLNIIVQARKLYPNFDNIIESYIEKEIQYVAQNALVMKDNPRLINSFKTYFQLTCGALLFRSNIISFDTDKQIRSYISGLASLLGE